jgi:hypothetical protein
VRKTAFRHRTRTLSWSGSSRASNRSASTTS